MNIVRRHELLKSEAIRRATYPKNYPPTRIHESSVSGFYYCGNNMISCYSCNLVLRDNRSLGPKDQHLAKSPLCDFLTGKDPSIPANGNPSSTYIASAELQAELIAQCSKFKFDDPPLMQTTFIATRNCEKLEVRQEMVLPIPAPELLTSVLDFGKYLAMMAKSSERYRSFRNSYLTTVMQLEPGQFVDNGFFGLPTGNAAQCFACALIIQNWSNDPDPAGQHLLLSPDCPFIKEKEVLVTPEVTYQCKACLGNHVKFAFGCGHLVCEPCNEIKEMKTCHLCRTEIVQRTKLYFC